MAVPSVAALLCNVMSTDPSPNMREHLFEAFCIGLAIFAFGDVKPVEPAAPKLALQTPAVEGSTPAISSDIEMIIDGVTNGTSNGLSEVNAEGGLIVEEDVSLESRKADIERTASIEGALAALKEELHDNEALKDALWKAIKSPVVALREQTDLLDICGILYEAVDKMCIKLRMPRFWKVVNLGKVCCIKVFA